MKKKCARKECGKSFLPTRPKQVYCSSKCRTYAFRKTNEDKVVGKKKKAKPMIAFVAPKPEFYDSPRKKTNDFSDEPKQWIEPKKEKSPPAGLSKTQMLKWYRENKSKK